MELFVQLSEMKLLLFHLIFKKLDILFGVVNPSGKLPITLPYKLEDTPAIALDDYNEVESLYPEGVFMGYRWFEEKNIEPMFTFGFGLSYTDFKYSNLRLSANTLKPGDAMTVKVDVTNTGKVAGGESVQLYVGDVVASVPRPAKELKGFDKAFLQPGQTKTFTLTINQRDLSFWDVKSNDWLAEAGEFTIMIGASVADIRLEKRFSYNQ